MGVGKLPSIETERLMLRQIEEEDLDEWTALMYADPEMFTYMPRTELPPEQRARAAFAFHAKTWAEHDFGGWLITDKTSGDILGTCYLEPDAGSGELELGYAVARRHWGKGISTEAARAVVRFGFEEGGVQRLVGVAMPGNVGSWKVLEKLGFAFSREDHLYDLDVLVYELDGRDYTPDSSYYRVHREPIS